MNLFTAYERELPRIQHGYNLLLIDFGRYSDRESRSNLEEINKVVDEMVDACISIKRTLSDPVGVRPASLSINDDQPGLELSLPVDPIPSSKVSVPQTPRSFMPLPPKPIPQTPRSFMPLPPKPIPQTPRLIASPQTPSKLGLAPSRVSGAPRIHNGAVPMPMFHQAPRMSLPLPRDGTVSLPSTPRAHPSSQSSRRNGFMPLPPRPTPRLPFPEEIEGLPSSIEGLPFFERGTMSVPGTPRR